MLIQSFVIYSALALVLATTSGCPDGDSLSPREACEGAAVAQCERVYACLSSAELVAFGLPESESSCVTAVSQFEGCSAKTLDNACVGNATYHADKAAACIEQLEGLDCSQIRDDVSLAVSAPACTQVCSID